LKIQGIIVERGPAPLLAAAVLGTLLLTPARASLAQSPSPPTDRPSAPSPKEPAPPAGDAYSQFLVGKIHRYDGDLGDAADSLSRAVAADDSSWVHSELAETYLRMGELSKAIEQARIATEKNPDDLTSRKMLAEAYMAAAYRGPDRQSAASNAIAEIKAILRLSPDENDMRMTLGRLLLQSDRTDEALEQFKAYRAAGGDPAQSGLFIGRALLQSGQKREAEVELQSVIALQPRNFEALLTLAQMEEDNSDWSAAAGYYARLVEIRPSDAMLLAREGYALFRAEQMPQAVTVLKDACSRNPSDRQTREMLVRALRADERPGEALRELDVLLQYAPDDPLLLIQSARIHESRGEVERALELYRRALTAAANPPPGTDPLEDRVKQGLTLAIAALEIDTHDPPGSLRTLEGINLDASELGLDAAILRIHALGASGDSEAAVKAAHEFVQLVPDDPRGPLILLEARLTAAPKGRPDQALAEFRPESRSPRELVAAAELLRTSGNTETGIAMLEKAVTSHPQDSSLYFALGALYERAGNTRKAETLMERAVEIDPKEARALNYLGYSLADRGKDLDRAESLIRQAVALDPSNGAYLDSLGWVLVKLGRYGEAEPPLARAADLMAGDATVREHLGDLYMKQNDVERALAEWRTAQGLRPEDPTRLRKKILKAAQDKK
jgi:tetratricopeptide (TPR) repeat protein